nr:solute carrier family 25 member 45 isoform X2 [Chrysemys picta bellii]
MLSTACCHLLTRRKPLTAATVIESRLRASLSLGIFLRALYSPCVLYSPCPWRSLWLAGFQVLGFFKGMSFPLLSVALVNSVLFGAYSNTLLYLSATHHHDRRAKPPSYVHVLTAGSFSGLMQAVVLAPIDLIKVRLQNQLHSYGLRSPAGASGTQYRGPVHCAASIFRKEGVMGLFRGTWALVLRDTPTMAIYFLTYTSLCQAMTVQGQEPGPMTVLVAGGCAGTASWILATPMDVIKARLQMDGVKGVSYHGVLDCIRISVRNEGPQVFLKGLALNCIRAFPVNAVTFLSYETILKLIC